MISYDLWYRLRQRQLSRSFDPGYYGKIWDYFTNIHPKTESQFNAQKFLAGWNPLYGSWMQSRSQDERNNHTRGQFGIDWADIQYPWLSGVTSGNESQVLGSASWQMSKNISRLYR